VLKRTLLCLALVYSVGVLGASRAWPQEDLSDEDIVAYEGDAEEEYAEEAPVEDEYAEEEYVEEEVVEEEVPPPPPQVRPQPAQGRPEPPRPRPVSAPSRRPLPGANRVTPVSTPTTRASVPFNGEKDGRTPDEPISFDFTDIPLYDVIKRIGMLTGRNFDVDPSAQNITVTLITHDAIPPEMAYEVLEALLARRGYSLVENLDGHIVEVVATADATNSVKIELYQGLEFIPDDFDGYSTHLVRVQYADAAELSSALKLVASNTARIDTYAPTNMLLITDTSDGLRRVRAFLEQVDIPGLDTTMEFFIIKYASADALASQIEQVLLDDGTGSAVTSTTTRARPTPVTRTTTRPVSRPTVPGAAPSQVIGERQETLRMVPDERLNALIVVASSGMMERVRDLIKRLDTPTPIESNNLHIYELLNADAEQVEEALQPMLGGSGRRSTRSSGASRAGTQQAAASTSGAADIQPFEQEVSVSRYDQTNSLLIMASPQDYRVLEGFIARLDVAPRQVYVEATVMSVSITDGFSLDVNAAGVTGNDGFGLTRSSTIASLYSTMTDATSLASAGGQFALGLLGLGTDGGFSTGVRRDITIEVDGQDVEIPYVPVLLQALETLTDLEVLSQPSLVTIDNEEASIKVGQEVPTVSASSRPATNSDGDIVSSSYGTTRVERQDVGIQLTVTPQISEGEKVRLDLNVEISEVANAEQSVGDANILGPTLNKSLVQNIVWVKDGETAVVAGLIRDSVSHNSSSAPILGDLPLIGWLFGSRGKQGIRQNMVLLLTPHIIKEGTDLERLTQHSVTEYHNYNIQQMFQEGFFKRVKQKKSDRNDHHPTLSRSEELTGRRSSTRFTKGDVKR